MILLTDRRDFGAPVRAIPKGYLRQRTTMTLTRARVFGTETEARAFLRAKVRGRKPFLRYRYTVTTLT